MAGSVLTFGRDGIIAGKRAWPRFGHSSSAFMLDLLGVNPIAAYSLRKTRSAYSGAAIRVRRSSDSAEQDIGFVGRNLDTAALLAFCGAGDGFVTAWYDQWTGAINLLQATAGSQPQIVASGVYLGEVLTTPTRRMAVTNAAFALHNQAFTILSVLGTTPVAGTTIGLIWALGTAANARIWLGTNGSTRDVVVRPNATNRATSPNLTLAAAGNVMSVTKTSTANTSGMSIRNNNGAASTVAAEALNATDNSFGISNSATTGIAYGAGHEEHIIVPGVLSADILAAAAKSAGAHFGITVA